MKRFGWIASALIAGLVMVPAPALATEDTTAASKMLAAEHVDRELIFSVQPGVDPLQTAAADFNSDFKLLSPDTYLVTVPWWYGSKLALAQLLADPQVEIAEPNFVIQRPAEAATSNSTVTDPSEASALSKLSNVSPECVAVVEGSLPSNLCVEQGYLVAVSSQGDRAALEDIAGQPLTDWFPELNVGAVQLSGSELSLLAFTPGVSVIATDTRVSAYSTVQDPAPWHLDRLDQAALPLTGTYGYEESVAGNGVHIFVVDSGVRSTHSEFGVRVAEGYNAVGADPTATGDCNGHGTSVASLAAGTTYGAAKSAIIVPVRVLGCDGTGSLLEVLDGLNWISSNWDPSVPAILNLSLGGPQNDVLDKAVNQLASSGFTIFVAAGNETDLACNYSPAKASGVIAIASSNSDDTFSYFSNYGDCVDLIAPGGFVTSAWIDSDTATVSISGTSMASGVAAGVAAKYMGYGYSSANIVAAIEGASVQGAISGVPASTSNLLLQSSVASPPTPSGGSSLPPTFNAPTVDIASDSPFALWSIPAEATDLTSQRLKLEWAGGSSLETVEPDATGRFLARLVPTRTYTVSVAGVNNLGVGEFSPPSEPFSIAHPVEDYFPLQWGLQSAQYATNTVAVWDSGNFGSREVVVGILDDGIDIYHPDLVDNIWTNPDEIPGNGIDDDNNGYVDDVHGWDFFRGSSDVFYAAAEAGHGTHVAGIVGAAINDIGVAGVSPEVTIVPLKIFDETETSLAAQLSALEYLRQLKLTKGMRVVASNNSYGGAGSSELFQQAIADQGRAGILFVAAAGNEDGNNDNPATPSYPANYDCSTLDQPWDCVLSVASLDSSGLLSDFSNYGPMTVDLAAPGGYFGDPLNGDEILSTIPDAWGYKAGTSMAAPFVTGAAALCAAANSTLTGPVISSLILQNLAPIDPAHNGLMANDGTLDVSSTWNACQSSQVLSFSGGPSSVQAGYTDLPGVISLTWNETAENAEGYIVRYAMDDPSLETSPCEVGADLQEILYVAVPGEAGVDVIDLPERETFCFSVQAFRGSQQSVQVRTNNMVTPDSTNMPWLYGKVTLQDGTPVQGVQVTVDQGLYVENGTFTDVNGDYFVQLDKNQLAQITISGPTSYVSSEVQTSTKLPLGLEVFGQVTLGDSNTRADIKLPDLRKVDVILQHDKYTPVVGAEVSASLATGTFTCSSLESDYRPSISLDFVDPSCSYSPNGPDGYQLTDSNGEVELVLVNSSDHSEFSGLSITSSTIVAGTPQTRTSLDLQDSTTRVGHIYLLPGISQPSQMAPPSLTSTSSSVGVSWDPPSDNGGMPILNYWVYYALSADGNEGGSWSVAPGDCYEVASTRSSCTISGLSASTTYFVRVEAENAAGPGFWSDAASISTLAATSSGGGTSGGGGGGASSGGGGGGGGGGAAPTPVLIANPGMDQLASRIEAPAGTTVEVPGGQREVIATGTGWAISFEPAVRIPDSGQLSVPIGASNPLKLAGYRPRSQVKVSVEKANFVAVGANIFDQIISMQSVTELGTFTTDLEGNLDENLVLPSSLEAGDYKLVITGDSLLSGSVRLALPISVLAVDKSFAVWTKKFGLDQGKMYAKNPAGVGKVVFKLNGKEIAWVRAEDDNDPKLRQITEGPMAGVNYLVRTVNFVKGKNALEIYVDGERVWRAAYTLK